MELSLIAAISSNYAIGKNNSLPWHLPNDLKLFKHLTTNQAVIMGRKTFDSIGAPLPNRLNIILTRGSNRYNQSRFPDIIISQSLTQAIEAAREYKQIFIIGGQEVFNEGINIASKLYITKVNTIIKDANAFFPKINDKIWIPYLKESFNKDKNHKYDYSFWVYKRK